MIMYDYKYNWKNNEKRKTLFNRLCRIVTKGNKNSICIEFEDGNREITSRYALKEVKMLKLIIAGSRTITDYELVKKNTIQVFKQLKELGYNVNKNNVEIVSGHAKGVDSLGEQFANEFGLKLAIIEPDWSLGRQAGILRNLQMIDYIKPQGVLIAFHKDDSKGTKHIIQVADYNNILKFVFNF